MEPLPEERNHRLRGRRPPVGVSASMEPLPEERNHSSTKDAYITAIDASMEPLPEERNHPDLGTALPAFNLPQWSRSRRSGITTCHPRRTVRTRTASMEPLPEERNHAADGDLYCACM